MLNYEIVQIDMEWDNLLLRMPNWNLFQTSRWINTYTDVYNPLGKVYGLVFHENGNVHGVLPVTEFVRYGIRVVGSPLWKWLVPFVGFAWTDRLQESMEAFGQFCRRAKVNYCSITVSDSYYEPSPTGNGHAVTELSKAIIKLDTDFQRLWQNVHRNQRNRIRKGQRNNIAIVEQNGCEYLEDYLHVRRNMYQRQGIYHPNNGNFLSAILRVADPSDYKTFLVVDGERVIAGFIVVLYRGICQAFDTASIESYRKGCHNCALNWHVIEWAKRSGYSLYDMGGANTPSIAFFKYSFGSVEQKYSMIESFSPAILSRLVEGFRVYKRRKNPKFGKEVPRSARMPT